jgi:hypothetical protein
MKLHKHRRLRVAIITAAVLIAACVSQGPGTGKVHRWWAGLGPVLPHESFPGDCKLCHAGSEWNTLVENFQFDHEAKTGVRLEGAHAAAQCLRCHNDRGPVATFQSKGCAGCHEDRHAGRLGSNCTSCHRERTWQPVGMVSMHSKTRFPLTGAHASVSCYRCHVGGFVGHFTPANSDCVSCHAGNLAQTTNPPHIPLGWTGSCERCHSPTRWRHGIRR